MRPQSVQSNLFGEEVVSIPETEGIKYAGSKLKLLPYIIDLVRETNAETVLDGFSGTTRLSQAISQLGYKVIANDIAIWSRIFGMCYLLNRRPKNYYEKIIKYLNSLPPKHGWFTEYYGGEPNNGSAIQKDGLKRPWQIHNTMKLDAIREEIDRLDVGEIEKAVLLTSLILALDSVDSTIGHYSSYLSRWSPRSYNDVVLKIPKLIEQDKEHLVFQEDVLNLLDDVEVDLAYFDPPYGSNNEKMPPSRVRYASYYHIWTTVILNDQPELFGKVRRRCDTSDLVATSVFEEFRKNPETGRFIVVEAIEQMLRKVKAKYVILSYSSGGRATANDLQETIRRTGELLKVVEVDYKKNVMAGMKWTNEWIREAEKPHQEFLFLIKK
ncbi:DNA adenine methylase [Mesotoga sp.]|uniref:DNA adenine methylase n=1 Tax=Mesotoga sp. TaxID=2053577 RepID=UPI00263A0214|nr:DNA adenine methylase [Mesotoga sp.]MDD4208349.1 DNA adenine methylase [Mesotoga sp.]